MTSRVDYEFVSKTWPTLVSMTYLNTASTGVPSQPVLDAMNHYLKMRTDAIWRIANSTELYAQVKMNLSRLLGGDASQYAFMPSTSAGLGSFGNSIEYPEGSNIVLCDMEFPSNYIPWQMISRRQGVELRVVKSNEGYAPTDAFADLIDENTRVVAVSHVQFGTGFRSDLKELAKLVHSHNGFLAVDIIQSAGWEEIDLPSLEVDFAAGQPTKWIAGPIGAGYAYINKKIMSQLQPVIGGWYSVKDHRNFGFFEREPKEDASKFEGGSPAVVAYAGLNEALKILLSLSSESRRFTAMDNASYLKKGLEEEDIPYYDFGERHNSPIISCVPKNVDTLEDVLYKEKIITSVRHGRLRVSPHFYNTYEEIDRLVDRLR
ncbi:MAG: aminotransferase class V-fold PLP-dependent enzyme [Candidatus Thorarchaeota archaeon]|jgi:selenocysteine lyase/cysteine desulfurase